MDSIDPQQFEFVRPIEWDEVFATWRDDEAHQERWRELYERHGYTSWEEWRARHIKPLKLTTRSWELYRFLTPLQTIPTLYGGPFASWKRKHYGDHDTLTFAQLAELPAIQTNEVITELLNDFPSPTTIMGIRHSERIVVAEGMHRCCAVARAAREGVALEATVFIALTDFGDEPLPQLDSTHRA